MSAAQVFRLPLPAERERELTYDELAVELRLSKRFLRYRAAEGMPVHTHYSGRRIFLLSEVVPWLDEWQRRKAS